jgi:hypothetical protein
VTAAAPFVAPARPEVVAYRCRAPRAGARLCGALLGYLPALLHWVGSSPDGPRAPRTIATLHCPRCHHWNLYDVLPHHPLTTTEKL